MIRINYEQVFELLSNLELIEELRTVYEQTCKEAKLQGKMGEFANDTIAFTVIISYMIEAEDFPLLKDNEEMKKFMESHGAYVLKIARRVWPDFPRFRHG